jgi:uncharacterized membrane protein YfcA
LARFAATLEGIVTELLLLLAGLAGGALNSLAGGGSFIVFPALLAAGVPPVLANATNTFAALPGYISGVAGFWQDVVKHRNKLVAYSIVSLVFGYAGAELLLHVSDEQFSRAVPWLMAFAVLLFAFGNRISRWAASRSTGGTGLKRVGTALLFLLLAGVCLYGGFFNAGLGILLLAFLALAGFTDIHAMNGVKLWISSLVAVVAVLRFAASGDIAWYQGIFALVGVTIGGYGAARLAHRIPAQAIRWLVIVYGVGLTVWFFYSTYWG